MVKNKSFSEKEIIEMTNAYLNRCKYIDSSIESSLRERENLKFPSPPLTTAERVKASRKYQSFADKWDELTSHIDERIDQLVDLKIQITKQIDELSSPEQKIILREHYINNAPLSKIGAMIGLKNSKSYMYVLRNEAIKAFFDLHNQTIIDLWKEAENADLS